MSRLKVGLFFGGRSTEHEVSVITALQAYEHLNKEKYDVIPIYVSKEGVFYTNHKFLEIKNYKDVDSLLLSSSKQLPQRIGSQSGYTSLSFLKKFTPLDIALPLFHGSFGEDGCIQGLFEIYQIPYVGFDVLASAIAMDKIVSKMLFKSLGFNVSKFYSFNRREWIKDQQQCLKEIKRNLAFPVFVKPGNIGSSIGINKAKDDDELNFYIEVAAIYSEKILIEEAFENVIEINCAALGYGDEVEASVCEMPVSSGEVLSFDDKYKRGGKGSKGAGMASLSRVIPAPISGKLTLAIQQATISLFKALNGCGVARVDYFVDTNKGKFWVNEINSPPGSLSFYLWEPKGVSFSKLLDQLIGFGLARYDEQKKTQYTFDSGLLSQMALKAGGKS